MRILDSWDQVLRRKTERLVKVLWQHRGVEEAMCNALFYLLKACSFKHISYTHF